MKKFLFVLVLAALRPQAASAEGVLDAPPGTGGQTGANRRVITHDAGFTAVRGNFTLPEMSLGGVVTMGGGFIGDSPFNSNPSFYFGCSREAFTDPEVGFVHGLEVDAGVQYEAKSITRPDGSTVPPGWGVVVRTTNKDSPSHGYFVNPAGGWRCGQGTLNPNVSSINMLWSLYKISTIDGGGIGGYLEVDAKGAAEQPTDKEYHDSKIRAKVSDGVPLSGAYRIDNTYVTTRVKRVVAINQGGQGSIPLHFPLQPDGSAGLVYQEDDSYLRNCTFSSGQVSQQAPPFGGPGIGNVVAPTEWSTWSSEHTDNTSQGAGGTGYYPGGNDKTIYRYVEYNNLILGVSGPLGHASGSLPVFSFPSIPQEQWDLAIPSRYADETVSINLRSYLPVYGPPIQPSGATGSGGGGG